MSFCSKVFDWLIRWRDQPMKSKLIIYNIYGLSYIEFNFLEDCCNWQFLIGR